MESSSKKLSALFFVSVFLVSSAAHRLDCGSCDNSEPPVTYLPLSFAQVVKPPVASPPIVTPAVPTPSVGTPPVASPPIVTPPVASPSLATPPVASPTIAIPPVAFPPIASAPGTPPATCPIDTIKLGACVDLLGGLIHIGLGDPAENKCCSVLAGLAEVEAAVCLCTTLKVNLLNLNIYLPIALELLATCGKSPPPGYTCSI
ncbi:36.4 kDa proline-rich protein-like [Cynara cardunculus var. scolymus]|uniref:Bifunctional inhibitor/plant lipid transfer protein/seed storage helical domain-containing protein n=1 Tax=Cynara cardunculus var. scolymus TaxID=59895 RepID=A0A124SI61_CYNCS|nr:36.4 kDa proline-rich protein-like [Cynara cardunculus var. scolymus]KVI11686.1 Bifunctional inhibitor/plant lipid transfer protein/seed storage helical domain-containing protein [Cynara cardunculus var. scolymus]